MLVHHRDVRLRFLADVYRLGLGTLGGPLLDHGPIDAVGGGFVEPLLDGAPWVLFEPTVFLAILTLDFAAGFAPSVVQNVVPAFPRGFAG